MDAVRMPEIAAALSQVKLQGKRIVAERLKSQLAQEEEFFVQNHPRSKALFERARANLLGGVPMHWMMRWAGSYPVFVKEASGAHFIDVDGWRYLDLCLGDAGAMTGHSPIETAATVAAQAARGITFMLPIEDVLWVGAELERRFGLKYWQFALTATDANRFTLRLARQITHRPYVLVYNWCYHGSVDESFITLHADGSMTPRRGNIGPPVCPVQTTRVIEFNDVDALERALRSRDVACVLAEPVMTNIGIVHPDPGYHDALREITRRTGTLLILDETHTICAGPGGYTRAHGLQPDMFTIGKPIAGGIPAAVYGFSEYVAERIHASLNRDDIDVGGIGGTLAGNALSIAAIRATLEHVLTEAVYARTIPLAERFVTGVGNAIHDFGLPWHVTSLGCRAEYAFCPYPPHSGGEAAAATNSELDRYMHLAALNRGILMTPFHNMALIAPSATEADIDYHTLVFRESVAAILGD